MPAWDAMPKVEQAEKITSLNTAQPQSNAYVWAGSSKISNVMGVVVTPSARETFTPRELAGAYKIFIERGPQYRDTETGIKAAAYRFGERVLLVYEESETDLVVLIHRSAWNRNSANFACKILHKSPARAARIAPKRRCAPVR